MIEKYFKRYIFTSSILVFYSNYNRTLYDKFMINITNENLTNNIYN